MKAAIVSDTHFGDPTCALVKPDGKGGYTKGEKFDEFLQAAGQDNDYLIMIGDVFDFSIASYQESYQAAKTFFELLIQSGTNLFAKDAAIVYQPGNHDFSFWHWVMHEVSAVRPLSNGGDGPKPNHFSVPGILDMRTNGSGLSGIHLHGVARQEDQDHPYGGLFLDHLTNKKIPFYVVYPNLYILTDHDTVLVTHGQYWDSIWALISEQGPGVLAGDLLDENKSPLQLPLKISDLVALNFPLNIFMSSAIGQAGPLTGWARMIQREAKDEPNKAAARVEEYIKRMLNMFNCGVVCKCLLKLSMHLMRKGIRKFIDDMAQNTPRYNEHYPSSGSQQLAFKNYFYSSLREIEEINKSPEFSDNASINRPTRLIFGHTHFPVSWSNGQHNDELQVKISNSGGWLKNKYNQFTGAEVFLLQNGDISSISIR